LARMSQPERPDIREPHQHRGEILPCRGDDFDLTRLLDGNRAQAGADGLFLQLAGGGAGQGPGEPSTWSNRVRPQTWRLACPSATAVATLQ